MEHLGKQALAVLPLPHASAPPTAYSDPSQPKIRFPTPPAIKWSGKELAKQPATADLLDTELVQMENRFYFSFPH